MIRNARAQFMFVAFGYIIISFFYLYPGGLPLLAGSSSVVMGDGTDSITAPYQFDLLRYSATHAPSELFYGAHPTKLMNAPEGMAGWHSWYDKITATLTSLILPIEQVSTSVVWISFVIDALCFYILGGLLGWKKPISFAAGLCWAICAYTRARAKVHVGFVATYFLPLIFIALFLLKRNRSCKDLIMAMVAFFFSAMAAQYYIIMAAFCAPFILYYYLCDSSDLQMIRQRLQRLVISLIPAILLLLWTLLMPVPSDIKSAFPKTGETQTGEIHPFLNRFGARAIDYVSGDIAIGLKDINPLRESINMYVAENLEGSNPHERTNGIRWSIWIFAFCGIYSILNKRQEAVVSKNSLALLGFAIFAFVLSLQPDWFGYNIGPAVWLHKLVSQIRVTSRAGIFVHFSLIMIACSYINTLKPKKWLWVFPLLIFIELPPFLNPMPMYNMSPAYASLAQHKEDGECGMGLYYPYVSGQWQLMEFYTFLNRMRGSRCAILNAAAINDRELKMINYFPLHPELMKLIVNNNFITKQRLVDFAKCASLSWIVFDARVPVAWRSEVCSSLGWQMSEAEVCQSQPQNIVPQKFNDQCLGYVQ